MIPLAFPPDVAPVLQALVAGLHRTLGRDLAGLYLYGSLVGGDFDPGLSDVDLLAVTTEPLNDHRFQQLHQMHEAFINQNPAWENRIDIVYLPAGGIVDFETNPCPIAVISPGEPFHRKTAEKEWVINLWLVRDRGVTLFGPPPAALIPPLPQELLVRMARRHALAWREWVVDHPHRKGQAYAVLTICRALYTVTNGAQVSKRQAARWAQDVLPDWAGVIEDALAWRQVADDAAVDPTTTYPRTVRFVNLVIDQIERIGL